jgi:polar amino acid transport system permease protein
VALKWLKEMILTFHPSLIALRTIHNSEVLMDKPKTPTSTSLDPSLVHEPSTTIRPDQRFDRWWILVAVIIVFIAYLVISKPDPYGRILAFVRDGIGITIWVTVASFLIVIFGGLLGGLGRLSKNWLIHGISTLYVETIRGIPALVQLFFWYFSFPSIIQGLGKSLNIPSLMGYQANPVGMAILGLSFCYSAYMSEVYRAGIQSISKGQMEAARSLGMTYFQAMRYVIIPQAVRVILPPVGNEFISLLKDSSLVSVVAVADMTRRGREFMSSTFTPIETWTMIALLYLTMTLFSARVVTWIERKTRLER